jgi:hypothetical protein
LLLLLLLLLTLFPQVANYLEFSAEDGEAEIPAAAAASCSAWPWLPTTLSLVC